MYSCTCISESTWPTRRVEFAEKISFFLLRSGLHSNVPFSPLFYKNIWLCCFGKDWDPHSFYGNNNLVREKASLTLELTR